MNQSIVLRALLVAAASIGFIGGGKLSLAHFESGDVCPMLGPLPACYLVFAGYGLMIGAALAPRRWFQRLFILGWTPIFALAFIGAVLHTLVGDTCPVKNGVPQCYLSLAVALVIFALFWFARRRPGRD